jgi:LEA14-like dessication related protein
MWRLFFMGFLILPVLTGCAGFGQQLESPPIKLANIQVKAISVFETVFQIQMRVLNTNDTALEIKGLECELELNDKPFAVGVSNSEVKIPSYGTEIVPVLVYSSVIDMLKGVQGLQNNDQIKYRLKGKLRLGGRAFPTVLPFQSEGTVPLGDLVRPADRSPKP